MTDSAPDPVRDELDILRLTYVYADLGDRGWAGAGADAPGLADLFVEDGVWASGTQVRLEGRQAIAAGLAASPVSFVAHLFVNPIITLDGDKANGRWKAVLLLTGVDGASRWGVSGYSIDYRRTEAGWRMANLQAGAIAWATTPAFDLPG